MRQVSALQQSVVHHSFPRRVTLHHSLSVTYDIAAWDMKLLPIDIEEGPDVRMCLRVKRYKRTLRQLLRSPVHTRVVTYYP